ncbi:MAG: LysM peptidoglycan-binding domain-containing protein [Bacteroidia bacterium]
MFKGFKQTILFVLMLQLKLISAPTDSLRVELRGGVKYIVHKVIKGEIAAILAKRYHVEESDIFSSNPLIAADVKPNQIILIPLNTSVYGDVKAAVIAPVVDGELPLATSLPPPTAVNSQNSLTVNQVQQEEKNSKESIKPVESTAITGKVLRKEINGSDTFLIYQVGPENSVTEVAKKFNVTDDAIKNYNNLESIVLLKDQIVRILIGSNTNQQETKQLTAEQKRIEIEKQQNTERQKQAMLSEKYPYTLINYNNKEVASYTVLEMDNLNEIADYFKTTPEAIKKQNKLNSNKIEPGTKLIIEPGKQFFDNLVEPTTEKPLVYNFEKNETKQQPNKSNLPDDLQKEVKQNEIQTQQQQAKNISSNNQTKKESQIKTRKTSASSEKEDSIKIEIRGTNVHTYNISEYRDEERLRDEWAEKIISENLKKVSSTSQNKGYGDKNTVHIVEKGETLQSIANKYGVRVTDIINWNELDVYRIRIAQELIINQDRYELDIISRNQANQRELTNSKEVEGIIEEGLVYFDPKAKFLGVLHPSLPIGKTIKIFNKENFLETYARVTGRLPKYDDPKIIIAIDRRIAEALRINNPTVKVRVSYGKIEKIVD